MQLLKISVFREVYPEKLQEVATTIKSSLRLPNVNKFFQQIHLSEYEHLTDVECIWYITQKQTWDDQNPNDAERTSLLMWQIAKKNQKLRKYLLRYILNDHFGYRSISQSIQFAFLSPHLTLILPEHIPLILIRLLIEPKRSDQFIKTVLELKLNDQEIYDCIYQQVQIDFPEIRQLLRQITISVCRFFCEYGKYADQVIRHLASETDSDIWLKAVEIILESKPDKFGEESRKIISQYLKKSVLPRKMSLSRSALDSLSNWIGIANFIDFASLIQEIREKYNNLGEWEDNQLNSRSFFWQNYSQRFHKIRILVPRKSWQMLSPEMREICEILPPEERNPSTELCIFDFGTKVIVEFFRGRCSEIRLFDDIYKEYLFTKSLTYQLIRDIPCQIHDHVYFWQNYCERWLAKHGIYPNDGLTQFRINKDVICRYNKVTGMPPPSASKVNDRLEKLKSFDDYWKRKRPF